MIPIEHLVAFAAVKIVGAAYLVYLGVQAIRHRREELTRECFSASMRWTPA